MLSDVGVMEKNSEKYDVEVEMNYEELCKEIGVTVEELEWTEGKEGRECNTCKRGDVVKSTMYVDWDRRRSIHCDIRFMKFVNENVGNSVGQDGMLGGVVNSIRTEECLWVVFERSMNERGNRNGKGIMKLRRAGRYKLNYEVDEQKLLDDLLLEKLELVKLQREAERDLEDREGGQDTDNLEVDNTVGVLLGTGEERIPVEAPENEQITEDSPPEEGNEIHIPEGTSRVVMRAKGIIRRGQKVKARRRRRDRIVSSQFRLHDVPVRRIVENTRLPSLENRLRESLRICKIFLTMLTEAWVEIPHLRCVHVKEKGRRMLSVASARIKFLQPDGMRKEVCTICFMIECAHKEIVTLNVMQSRELSVDGNRLRGKEILSCSCNVVRENGIIVQSKCMHTDILQGCNDVIDALRKSIQSGFSSGSVDSEGEEVFGTWIIVEDRKVSVGEEEEEDVICTQLDQVDGKMLTDKGKSIGKRWSCWNVLDVEDNNFVCCVRSALGSGIALTKMRCFQCKLGSQRRCRHETGCTKVLANGLGVGINDNGEIVEEDSVQGEAMNRTIGNGTGNRDRRRGEQRSDDEYSSSDSGSEEGDTDDDIGQNDVRTEEHIDRRNTVPRGRCLGQPLHFWASTHVRPLFMCPAERRLTGILCDVIEKWERRLGGLCFIDPMGWPCAGVVMDVDGNEVQCRGTRVDGCTILPRKVTLFTLNQDVMSVVLKDWVCGKCRYENRYTGHAQGIFPATRQRAFTVDLMYFWVHECAGHAMSFRSLFELTTNLQATKSYRRRFQRKRVDMLAPEHKSDRRLANESLRRFCTLLDLRDESECTKMLFSCTKCEVPLEWSDYKQLGLRMDILKDDEGLKRFKSLVMDGKVIGSLRDYPVQTGEVHALTGAKGVVSKVMDNRLTRASLKYLSQGVRKLVRAVEYGRGAHFVHNISRKDGVVYFRLGSLLQLRGVTKHNYWNVLRIARWFCDEQSCLCPASEWKPCRHHGACVSQRVEMLRRNGCAIASRVLSKILGVNGNGTGGDVVETDVNVDRSARADLRSSVLLEERNEAHDDSNASEQNGGNDDEEGEEGVDTESENGDPFSEIGNNEGGSGNGHDIRNEWVYFRVDDAFACTEVLEAVLENIQFALGEPVTLGFLPWFTHGDSDDNKETAAQDGNGSRTRTGDRGQVEGDAAFGPEWDDWSVRYMSELGADGSGQSEMFQKDPRRRLKVIGMLTAETEKLHTDACSVLAEFSTCTHDSTMASAFPCTPCLNRLEKCGKRLTEQNSTASLLIQEIVRVGSRAPKLSRIAAEVLRDLIDAKLNCLQKFKAQAAKKMDKSVSAYWSRFGHFGNKFLTDSDREAYDSMYVFPGRTLRRPPIKSVGNDKPGCSKNYVKSRKNLSSFLSLQCPCNHPKIIGFTLLKQVESIAMALSTVMGFLNLPPRTLWYDNACNLYDSALVRTPYLLRSCYFIVDRFHYQGHNCSNHYNPDRYKSLTNDRSVAAEVLNSVLEQSTGFIRYLKGENVKPYLKIMFAIHNFKSMLKDEFRRKELPPLDLHKLYAERFPCTCAMCAMLDVTHLWRTITTTTMSFLPIHDVQTTDGDHPP